MNTTDSDLYFFHKSYNVSKLSKNHSPSIYELLKIGERAKNKNSWKYWKKGYGNLGMIALRQYFEN